MRNVMDDYISKEMECYFEMILLTNTAHHCLRRSSVGLSERRSINWISLMTSLVLLCVSLPCQLCSQQYTAVSNKWNGRCSLHFEFWHESPDQY